ncbi:MAG: hypothetical protein ACK419_05210, partial [Pyrinomonadaceae bacterium]
MTGNPYAILEERQGLEGRFQVGRLSLRLNWRISILLSPTSIKGLITPFSLEAILPGRKSFVYYNLEPPRTKFVLSSYANAVRFS